MVNEIIKAIENMVISNKTLKTNCKVADQVGPLVESRYIFIGFIGKVGD